jgi:hypothetical protein
MTPADLDALEAQQQNAAALNGAVLQGLLRQGWGRAPALLSDARCVDALRIFTHWIRIAPLQREPDIVALLQARGPLRRLVEALGGQFDQVLRDAFGGAVQPAALGGPERIKLALLADARCALDFDLVEWASHEPVWAMLFTIQALDCHLLEPRALAATQLLLQTLERLPLATLPLYALQLLQRACFLVSYIDSPVRYVAKRRLVEQARHILNGHGLLVDGPRQPRAVPDAAKPRLVAIGEGMAAGHAVWRFFAEPMRDLRQHFEVTLLGTDESLANVAGDLADAFVPFERTADPLRVWAAQVQKMQPDIIFYPGIGMSFATYSLSLQRLAPLQVASVATPASSCSSEIDATLLFEGLHAPDGFGPVKYYDHHILRLALASLPESHAKSSDVPCIGVNAVAMKLNDAFFTAIETVLARYGRPCRLRFMPNVAGVELQGLMRIVLQRFPGAEVLPSMNHAAYLEALAECDIVLQSFPFGGANTTNDALDLGIPVVALASEFISGQTDRTLLQVRDLDSLCTTNVEEYVALALRLLEDRSYAAEVRDQLANLPREAGRSKRGNVTIADAILQLWEERNAAAGAQA